MPGYLDVTHIGLSVEGDLRAAEIYYSELFDLQLSWREPVPADAPFDLPWDQVESAGIRPEVVMLAAGAFRLAITSAPSPLSNGRIDHVGLQTTVEQLQRVRHRAIDRGYAVIADREDELFDFRDAYGVEWELDTRSFANPRSIVEQKRERERSTR